MLQDKTVVLGVTGSIAAYKAAELARRLAKLDVKVKVVMTEAATHFITPLTFRTLTKNPVLVSLFQQQQTQEVPHISLADEADLIVVAPATANIVAKAANGIADDALSTTILATQAPVIFAPAMNEKMYANSLTQTNLDNLEERGCVIVNPAEGELACGVTGAGRLADLEKITEAIRLEVKRGEDLKGKEVLVTAGGTQESIDSVRYIGNRATGKMGNALAREAALRGAYVTLVGGVSSGQTSQQSFFPSSRINSIPVTTTEEMKEKVFGCFDKADITIKAAAVADFRPKRPESKKIKKSKTIALELESTPDILFELGKMKNGKVLVGFAAESENLVVNAKKKLKEKKLDLVVANDISKPKSGFGTDDIEFTLIDKNENVDRHHLMSKRRAARVIVDKVVDLL